MRFKILCCFFIFIINSSVTAAGVGNTPYFEIKTPFVVNLANTGSLSFLQVNAELKVKNEDIKKLLYMHLPAIQHTMMMILSEQTAGDIKSVAGKQNLRKKTLKEIQQLLVEQIGTEAIDDIFFTAFIVQ